MTDTHKDRQTELQSELGKEDAMTELHSEIAPRCQRYTTAQLAKMSTVKRYRLAVQDLKEAQDVLRKLSENILIAADHGLIAHPEAASPEEKTVISRILMLAGRACEMVRWKI